MNISIQAKNTSLTPAIKSAIEDKLQILDKFLKDEDKLFVEVEEDKHHQTGLFSRVEIRISPHGNYAEANGSSFYEALDLVVPKITVQLRRSKDKEVSLRRKLGNAVKRIIGRN